MTVKISSDTFNPSHLSIVAGKCATVCMRAISAGLVGVTVIGLTAIAQTIPDTPPAPVVAAVNGPQLTVADNPFLVKSVSNSLIKMGARAFEQGDYKTSIAMSRQALESGLSNSRKAAAFTNLCAAYGALGQYSEALAACDGALALRGQPNEALYNRGLIRFAMGDREAANSDFADSGLSRN